MSAAAARPPGITCQSRSVIIEIMKNRRGENQFSVGVTATAWWTDGTGEMSRSLRCVMDGVVGIQGPGGAMGVSLYQDFFLKKKIWLMT